MYSKRFNRPIIVTSHAQLRMIERDITEVMLIDIIDTGTEKYSDESHLWVFKHFPDRPDNLICAVLVLENAVVIKTVMHHFSVE